MRHEGGKGFAHLHLDPWLILHPTTAAGLGLKGPVKTMDCIEPVFDGQYEAEEGAGLKLSFDPSGRLVEYDCYDFGDACGHTKYSFKYAPDGRIVAAMADCMTGTQDPCQDDQSVVSYYNFTYKDGRLSEFTEQTRSVWGKAVDWPVFHFRLNYTADGQLSDVRCVEQPKVHISYRGNTERSGIYVNEAKYLEHGCRSEWTFYLSPDYYKVADAWLIDPDQEDEQEVKYIYDSHGNWTKCYWPMIYDGKYHGEDGEFRRYTYY